MSLTDKKHQHQRGFSLMELFCVLAIVAIMLTASIMYFSSFSRSQDIAGALEEVEVIVHAASAYLNTHGSYKDFSSKQVQKTGLIKPNYNFLFTAGDGSKVLAVPWTDAAKGKAGVGVFPTNSPLYDRYTIRFTAVPAWACSTLVMQMNVIATKKTVTCGAGETTLDFILPKGDAD